MLRSEPPPTASVKALETCLCFGSLLSNSKIKPYYCTPTTQISSIMAKALVHNIRTHTALKKKNDTAADNLQKQVVLGKKMQEEKKKQRAEENEQKKRRRRR